YFSSRKFTSSRSRCSPEWRGCRLVPSSHDCTAPVRSSSRCSAPRCEMLKEVAMLPLDELEKLSRFAAGDLSAQEAEQVKADLERRPELAEALAQLSRLDAASQALPQTLRPDQLDALIARIQRPSAVPSIQLGIAAAVAFALVASGAALWLWLAR